MTPLEFTQRLSGLYTYHEEDRRLHTIAARLEDYNIKDIQKIFDNFEDYYQQKGAPNWANIYKIAAEARIMAHKKTGLYLARCCICGQLHRASVRTCPDCGSESRDYFQAEGGEHFVRSHEECHTCEKFKAHKSIKGALCEYWGKWEAFDTPEHRKLHPEGKPFSSLGCTKCPCINCCRWESLYRNAPHEWQKRKAEIKKNNA